MNCPSCEFENVSESIYCSKCGTHLASGKQNNNSSPLNIASDTMKNAVAAAKPGVTVAVQAAERERKRFFQSLLNMTPKNKILCGLVASVLGFGNFGLSRPTLAPLVILLLSVILVLALYLLVVGVTEMIVAGIKTEEK